MSALRTIGAPSAAALLLLTAPEGLRSQTAGDGFLELGGDRIHYEAVGGW